MKNSKIEWTEMTWNPSIGCSKISEGCKFCYAESMAIRLQSMKTPGYENAFKFRIMPERLEYPMAIKKPTMFFVNSMSDLFHEEMPFSFLDKVFDVIRLTPEHTYQILTKREKILESYFADRLVPENAWLGVTVESHSRKNRIEVLRGVNSKIRFLSIEPLLNDIGELNLHEIHWVIVGGESGHKSRPMKPEWAINIQKQCEEQNVSFFFKQWGAWGADGQRRSKKTNGRVLLGKEWNGFPEAALVQA
jgi:protein gp37